MLTFTRKRRAAPASSPGGEDAAVAEDPDSSPSWARVLGRSPLSGPAGGGSCGERATRSGGAAWGSGGARRPLPSPAPRRASAPTPRDAKLSLELRARLAYFDAVDAEVLVVEDEDGTPVQAKPARDARAAEPAADSQNTPPFRYPSGGAPPPEDDQDGSDSPQSDYKRVRGEPGGAAAAATAQRFSALHLAPPPAPPPAAAAPSLSGANSGSPAAAPAGAPRSARSPSPPPGPHRRSLPSLSAQVAARAAAEANESLAARAGAAAVFHAAEVDFSPSDILRSAAAMSPSDAMQVLGEHGYLLFGHQSPAVSSAPSLPSTSLGSVPPPPPPPPPPPSPPPSSQSGGGSMDSGLGRLLMNAAAGDAAALADFSRFPPGYSVREARTFDEPGLAALSAAFHAEDPRAGRLPLSGRTGGARGRVALLFSNRPSEGPVGYVMHFDNQPPPWERAGAAGAAAAATLPPRLSHLYVSPPLRRQGLGTALLAWWRSEFAAPVKVFAVEAPNEGMGRALARLGCAPAQRASGYEAAAVHYLHM